MNRDGSERRPATAHTPNKNAAKGNTLKTGPREQMTPTLRLLTQTVNNELVELKTGSVVNRALCPRRDRNILNVELQAPNSKHQRVNRQTPTTKHQKTTFVLVYKTAHNKQQTTQRHNDTTQRQRRRRRQLYNEQRLYNDFTTTLQRRRRRQRLDYDERRTTNDERRTTNDNNDDDDGYDDDDNDDVTLTFAGSHCE